MKMLYIVLLAFVITGILISIFLFTYSPSQQLVYEDDGQENLYTEFLPMSYTIPTTSIKTIHLKSDTSLERLLVLEKSAEIQGDRALINLTLNLSRWQDYRQVCRIGVSQNICNAYIDVLHEEDDRINCQELKNGHKKRKTASYRPPDCRLSILPTGETLLARCDLEIISL